MLFLHHLIHDLSLWTLFPVLLDNPVRKSASVDLDFWPLRMRTNITFRGIHHFQRDKVNGTKIFMVGQKNTSKVSSVLSKDSTHECSLILRH